MFAADEIIFDFCWNDGKRMCYGWVVGRNCDDGGVMGKITVEIGKDDDKVYAEVRYAEMITIENDRY